MFAQLNRKQFLQPGKRPFSRQYTVSCFLANCHNCLRPGQIAQYFDVQPPTLEKYFSALRPHQAAFEEARRMAERLDAQDALGKSDDEDEDE